MVTTPPRAMQRLPPFAMTRNGSTTHWALLLTLIVAHIAWSVEGAARFRHETAVSTVALHQTITHVGRAMITPPPDPGSRPQRALTYSGSFLFAANDTCGYFSGSKNDPWVCVSTKTCAFATAAGGFLACCNATACDGGFTACVDSSYIGANLCGAACSASAEILKCSRTASPYCAGLTFFNGIVDYLCTNRSLSTLVQMETTYKGQQNAPSLSPGFVGINIFASLSQSDQTASSSGNATSPSVVASSSGTNPQPSTQPSSSGVPPTAIIGGAVGGSAAIVLAGLAVWFFFRRRDKKKHSQRESAAFTPSFQSQGNFSSVSPDYRKSEFQPVAYEPPTSPATQRSPAGSPSPQMMHHTGDISPVPQMMQYQPPGSPLPPPQGPQSSQADMQDQQRHELPLYDQRRAEPAELH
ncbi:hypothetical protein Micbo1qcDRAFT_54345 [Microdochium bolleyi]|uniref:Mid2 domain-containing protein n=1 Tax=Microdochium bolleyi TaxID=196109 RepID=A0A136J7Y0_9PEZI|nr:hypothetical protein Micbo1qcDRAFT_54345 [Microdochium bolleyi]